MATNIVRFSRFFQMWTYTVGHKQLLLRSTMTEQYPTRVDVLFKDVGAMHLPTTMEGLSIFEGDPQMSGLNVQLDAQRKEGRKLFAVSGASYAGYVVAGLVAWHEDDGDYQAPSYFAMAP